MTIAILLRLDNLCRHHLVNFRDHCEEDGFKKLDVHSFYLNQSSVSYLNEGSSVYVFTLNKSGSAAIWGACYLVSAGL